MSVCDPTSDDQLFLINTQGINTTIQSYTTGQCLLPNIGGNQLDLNYGSCIIPVTELIWGDCPLINSSNSWLSIPSIPTPPAGAQSTWNTQGLEYSSSLSQPPVLGANLLTTLNDSGWTVVYQTEDAEPYLALRKDFYNNNCDTVLKNTQYFPLPRWNQVSQLPVCDYTSNVIIDCATIPL
jgi:hypothetical protein